MKKMIIICQHYYDIEKDNISIGGIQTYIDNLIPIAVDLGLTPIVILFSNFDYTTLYKGIRIYGVDVTKVTNYQKKADLLFKFAKTIMCDDDIVLFATESFARKCKHNKVIAIQHGVYWDKPSIYPISDFKQFIYLIKNFIFTVNHILTLRHVNKLVCVDANYINWYRSHVLYPTCEYEYIPNFASVPRIIQEKPATGTVNIIFARRFEIYRGTRIFTSAIKRILNKYSNVFVTIAGEGPDEDYIHTGLSKFENRVKYIKFNASESLKVHSDQHIAVIPTIGSEGTSLSLLEAMASRCAVICTNVGGMSNIVIDNFNGLLINPHEDRLYDAIERLIQDRALMDRLSKNAYECVKDSFSYDIWARKWKSIIFDEIQK